MVGHMQIRTMSNFAALLSDKQDVNDFLRGVALELEFKAASEHDFSNRWPAPRQLPYLRDAAAVFHKAFTTGLAPSVPGLEFDPPAQFARTLYDAAAERARVMQVRKPSSAGLTARTSWALRTMATWFHRVEVEPDLEEKLIGPSGEPEKGHTARLRRRSTIEFRFIEMTWRFC